MRHCPLFIFCVVTGVIAAGFSVEGQTISHRLHSSLVRLVLSLSRLQVREGRNACLL